MKILFEHSHILPVNKYGGTERIMFWHMKELVRHDHQVYLIADYRSQVEEYGIKLIPHNFKTQNGDWRSLIPKDIDLIHLTYKTELQFDIPCLLTVHGNGQPGEIFPLNTNFISRAQAQNHGSTTFVYNGIDLDEYPFERAFHILRGENFLFLGKGSWKVKNLKGCIEYCKKSKKHLHIAGGRAFTFSPLIHSYGMVDQATKIKLLSKCDALLFPVRWPEPFGLAIIEAWAFGLPVVGSPYGSLLELINKDTGLVARDGKHLVEILQDFPLFRRKVIREYVYNNFKISIMTKNYLELYQKVINNIKINNTHPCWLRPEKSLELAPF